MFIFAFALGFYILLHKDDGHVPDDDEYRFFDFLGLTVVKTFTMFVGELEFADLPIETPVGYIFLLVFVFLIVVVMMNLLNGLAVSDTGIIKQEAEIHYYKCQAEVIMYIESMLLGDPFDILSNWPAFIWLRRFPKCSLGNTLYRIPPLRKMFHKITGAPSILLFYDHLPEKKITFYPNHEPNLCGCFGGREAVELPPSILEAVKNVFIERLQAKNGAEERLARAEEMLHDLQRENDKLASKLDRVLDLLEDKRRH